jgi:hypothetical protein
MSSRTFGGADSTTTVEPEGRTIIEEFLKSLGISQAAFTIRGNE